MVRLLGLMNLLLAAFNLLPGLPLDGGRVLHALIWRRHDDRARATRVAVAVGRVLGVVMMLGGGLLVVGWGDLAGIWLLAVGWFLYQAAAGSLLHEQLRERAGRRTIGDVMRPLFESADGSLTVAALLNRYGWGDHLRTLPVTIDGRVRGIVGDREIAATASDVRSTVKVAEVMTAIGRRDVVAASEPILEFLGRDASPARRVLVTDEDRVVGIVTGEELAHLFE
jgi:predicted transcriptional regulator